MKGSKMNAKKIYQRYYQLLRSGKWINNPNPIIKNAITVWQSRWIYDPLAGGTVTGHLITLDEKRNNQ
jgi:hypothetical protein